jgi:hypothetical protein
MRPSRRALVAGLLILASAGCELITPLDFVGNGADAETRAQEAGEAAAEASSVTGAADGALRPGDGAPNPGDGTTESGTTPNPESCQRSPFGCFGGVACGCHSFPSPNDAGSADAVVSANPDSASADSESSTPPPPTNLITNGNFAAGTRDWAVVSGTASDFIFHGDLCVAVTAANDTTTIVLGWPEPAGSAGVPLSATGSYTFSYTAYATMESVTVNATVGDSVGPNYKPIDFESSADAVTTSATVLTHPFIPANGADPSAGVSFSFVSKVAQWLCFSSVSLVENQ